LTVPLIRYMKLAQLLFVFAVLFIVLKFTGSIDWDWIWVLLPIWIIPSLFVLIIVSVLLIGIVLVVISTALYAAEERIWRCIKKFKKD